MTLDATRRQFEPTSKLNVFAAEDFPRLPAVDLAPHTVATASLLETVDRVARSASKDESRPVLTGIQVRFEGTPLLMAATDSYRLSFKETQLEEAGPDLDAIIPARALAELARIASGTETVTLGVNEHLDVALEEACGVSFVAGMRWPWRSMTRWIEECGSAVLVGDGTCEIVTNPQAKRIFRSSPLLFREV